MIPLVRKRRFHAFRFSAKYFRHLRRRSQCLLHCAGKFMVSKTVFCGLLMISAEIYGSAQILEKIHVKAYGQCMTSLFRRSVHCSYCYSCAPIWYVVVWYILKFMFFFLLAHITGRSLPTCMYGVPQLIPAGVNSLCLVKMRAAFFTSPPPPPSFSSNSPKFLTVATPRLGPSLTWHLSLHGWEECTTSSAEHTTNKLSETTASPSTCKFDVDHAMQIISQPFCMQHLSICTSLRVKTHPPSRPSQTCQLGRARHP